MEADLEDMFDYPMSDDFVSETRLVPYRTGFRTRQCRGKLPLEKVNALSDRDFKRYIQNGCRFPDPEQDRRDQLAKLREVIRVQALQLKQLQEADRRIQFQIEQLRSLLPLQHQQTPAHASGAGSSVANPGRGLDVPKR